MPERLLRMREAVLSLKMQNFRNGRCTAKIMSNYGTDAPVVTADSANAGDFFFATKKEKGLQEKAMTVDERLR